MSMTVIVAAELGAKIEWLRSPKEVIKTQYSQARSQVRISDAAREPTLAPGRADGPVQPLESPIDPALYLAHVVVAVHESGFVPAAATAKQPTWRAALDRLQRDAQPAPADRRRAREILGW